MQKIILALAISFSLAGCATSISGNYAMELPQEAMTVIATDSAQQLAKVFQPSASTLAVTASSDGFSQALTDALAQTGFQLPAEGADGAAVGSALGYVVDSADTGLYRVTLNVEGVKLSRAYGVKAGQAVPVGAWTQIGE